MIDIEALWRFFPAGFLITIFIETLVLLVALSPVHPLRRKLIAGVWLTACTYPIVILVMPLLPMLQTRWVYLLVAEIFAPVAECVLFWLVFGKAESRASRLRDFIAIILANLASFGAGEWLYRMGFIA